MYKRLNFEPMDKHLSESIRGKLEEAEALIMQLPAGRNRSIALTKLEDTMLRANLAISDAVAMRSESETKD